MPATWPWQWKHIHVSVYLSKLVKWCLWGKTGSSVHIFLLLLLLFDNSFKQEEICCFLFWNTLIDWWLLRHTNTKYVIWRRITVKYTRQYKTWLTLVAQFLEYMCTCIINRVNTGEPDNLLSNGCETNLLMNIAAQIYAQN